MHFGAEYPFIIGEYVPGGSIGSRIDAGDWPDEKEALAATIGALDGLAAIHAREIVHRDIKPGNVALRGSDWTDPVILDLGLVRNMLGRSIRSIQTYWARSSSWRRNNSAGSARYADRTCSAAVTLFVLLTRRLPFFEVDEQTVAIEVLEERIRDEDWPKWDDSIQPDVQQVLDRMLLPDAFKRSGRPPRPTRCVRSSPTADASGRTRLLRPRNLRRARRAATGRRCSGC